MLASVTRSERGGAIRRCLKQDEQRPSTITVSVRVYMFCYSVLPVLVKLGCATVYAFAKLYRDRDRAHTRRSLVVVSFFVSVCLQKLASTRTRVSVYTKGAARLYS